MGDVKKDFELYLSPGSKNQVSDKAASSPGLPLRKFATRLPPGRTRYEIAHGLGSEDVLVQTRIAGNIREGGVSILDKNTVCLTFGGTLNESMDVVIIG
jgi:hypothetical protein